MFLTFGALIVKKKKREENFKRTSSLEINGSVSQGTWSNMNVLIENGGLLVSSVIVLLEGVNPVTTTPKTQWDFQVLIY